MSVDVQPGPAQRRQQLGPRVGVEARRAERVAHLGDQRLEPLRPGAARRPRPEQVGEQPLVDVDPPRHAGVRHLGRDERTRRLRREQQPEPDGLGRCRHGSQLPSVLEVGAQVLGRVVDREQRRIGRRARPEPVPVLRLLPLQQPHVHRGRPPQQVVAQPQVVAALDPHPGRQQRRVPPRGVVPHPARRVDLARAHVRRQVGHRHLALQVTVDHQHAVARQARERDPGHGDTLTSGADTESARLHDGGLIGARPASTGVGQSTSNAARADPAGGWRRAARSCLL